MGRPSHVCHHTPGLYLGSLGHPERACPGSSRDPWPSSPCTLPGATHPSPLAPDWARGQGAVGPELAFQPSAPSSVLSVTPNVQRKYLTVFFLFCRKVTYLNMKASFVNAHTVCGVDKGGKEVRAQLSQAAPLAWFWPFQALQRCSTSAPFSVMRTAGIDHRSL